jgi:hypothetical protein
VHAAAAATLLIDSLISPTTNREQYCLKVQFIMHFDLHLINVGVAAAI